MRIAKDTLRGYILEEVLASLIKSTGYRLLVDPQQDPQNLRYRGNGLVVQGRGAEHQVDVLGELLWMPAFTFPLRLFVEAKFRDAKTGIGAVRNGVGVLLDINQQISPNRSQEELPHHYHYAYAMFSTSGFSQPAVDMAIAHQISLIDLAGKEFADLRKRITEAADAVTRVAVADEPLDRPDDDREGIGRAKLLSGLRTAIRKELQTWPEGLESLGERYDVPGLHEALAPAFDVARDYRELFVAMADGPFMLLLKEDRPGGFVEYANRHRTHKVAITWSERLDAGMTWAIVPAEGESAYRLTFRLPSALGRWVFGSRERARRRALHAKQEYFSNITIYRHVHGEDYLYRLEYDPGQSPILSNTDR